MYHYFDEQANGQGLSKNAFLESLLSAHQIEDELITSENQPSEEFSLTDYFDEEFSQILNDIFVAAGDGWNAVEDPQGSTFF